MNKQLCSLIEPVVKGLGFNFWGLEYLSRGKYSALKIYIDLPDGVGVEDCARVSRQVSSLLAVEDPLKSQYTLEVSSPGMDRRLFTLSQFEIFKGAEIRLNLHSAFKGKRRYQGVLCGIETDEIVLRVEAEEILFPLEEIDKANVIPKFS